MTDFWGEKLYNSHFQKCELWNQYPNVWLEQSNLICFLLNHSAHIFYEIRIPSFIFCISLLIYIQPQTTAFSSNHSQKPWAAISEKQNKTKTHIKTPQNTLIKALFEVWDRLSCESWPLCSMLHIIFIRDLNILEELEPSFLLSCHPPTPNPLEMMGIWQAPSLDSQTTGGTWFQFLHPVISDSRDILFLQG